MFLSLSFLPQDSLKELGFFCAYNDKFWELPARKYSVNAERRLRFLMRASCRRRARGCPR